MHLADPWQLRHTDGGNPSDLRQQLNVLAYCHTCLSLMAVVLVLGGQGLPVCRVNGRHMPALSVPLWSLPNGPGTYLPRTTWVATFCPHPSPIHSAWLLLLPPVDPSPPRPHPPRSGPRTRTRSRPGPCKRRAHEADASPCPQGMCEGRAPERHRPPLVVPLPLRAQPPTRPPRPLPLLPRWALQPFFVVLDLIPR